jgi:hypothetical protein
MIPMLVFVSADVDVSLFQLEMKPSQLLQLLTKKFMRHRVRSLFGAVSENSEASHSRFMDRQGDALITGEETHVVEIGSI